MIWLDYRFYFLWESVKISGGYRSDSAIPGHLLSSERRRQVPYVYPFHVHFITLLVPFIRSSYMFLILLSLK